MKVMYMSEISQTKPSELTNLYNKIVAAATLTDDIYVYSGDDAEILNAIQVLAEFGFGSIDEKTIPKLDPLPWLDW